MKDDDLLSEASSHSEAAQVYNSWLSEDEDMNNIVSDEDDDFMQLEDEDLLPSGLEFYDTIAQTMSSDDSIGMMLLSSSQDISPPTLISTSSGHSCSSNGSFVPLPSMEDDRTYRFQSTLYKLGESMRRSQESRRSLYARTPDLKDYKRLNSVKRVLQSVEFSTHHVDACCKAMKSPLQ